MLISTLTGTISHGSNDWLVDSGAFKHMMGYKELFVNVSKHDSPHKVKLGDDYQYPIKGSGEYSYKLEYGKYLNIKNVIYVLGLNKNILTISALDAKGIRVLFVDAQVPMRPKGKEIGDGIVIREEDESLYKCQAEGIA